MLFSYRLPLMLILIFLLAACSSATATPAPPLFEVQPQQQAAVTIDMFSGRPSPSWVMNDRQLSELAKRLGALPVEPNAHFSDGLGYRGFLIDMPQAQVRIEGGFVRVEQNGQIQTYRDTQRETENWLVEQSQPHLDAPTFKFLSESLPKPS